MEKVLSIIVADDDSFYTWGIEQGLRRLNAAYRVQLASNGRQLVEMLSKIRAGIERWVF